MAKFFSKHRELRVHLGETVSEIGDKKISSMNVAVFKDNIFSTDDEKMIKLLRAHKFFSSAQTGGFFETDEKTDRAALIENKKLIEQGTEREMVAATTAVKPPRSF